MIFNRKKKVELFVSEKNVCEIWRKIYELSGSQDISTGWCAWANQPDCWWISCSMDYDHYRSLVGWINEQDDVVIYNPELIV